MVDGGEDIESRNGPYPCGHHDCPIREEVIPAIRQGDPLPTDRLAHVPNADLVSDCCTTCPVWQDDRRVRRYAAEWDLRQLEDQDPEVARDLNRGLRATKRALGESDFDEADVVAVLRRLQDVRQAASEVGHDQALEPLVERRLRQMFKRFIDDPDLLFGFAGAGTEEPVSDSTWDRYLARLRDRVEDEGGELTRRGDAATLTVRGQQLTVLRDATGATIEGRPVVVTNEGIASVARRFPSLANPVIVKLPPRGPQVDSLGPIPGWVRCLLDPRSGPELIEEARARLVEGDSPPVATEPFITASKYKDEFPTSALAGAFHRLEEDGRGRIRDVPGVGLVLVTDW